ncbi:alpha/beta fold hydrolase, partial [Sanguibacter suaedae]
GPRVRATYFGASSGADLRHLLGAVDVPVAVLAGTEDRTVPLADVRATARGLGLLGPVELAGRGHALPVEAPGDLVRAVLGVLHGSVARGDRGPERATADVDRPDAEVDTGAYVPEPVTHSGDVPERVA